MAQTRQTDPMGSSLALFPKRRASRRGRWSQSAGRGRRFDTQGADGGLAVAAEAGDRLIQELALQTLPARAYDRRGLASALCFTSLTDAVVHIRQHRLLAQLVCWDEDDMVFAFPFRVIQTFANMIHFLSLQWLTLSGSQPGFSSDSLSG